MALLYFQRKVRTEGGQNPNSRAISPPGESRNRWFQCRHAREAGEQYVWASTQCSMLSGDNRLHFGITNQAQGRSRSVDPCAASAPRNRPTSTRIPCPE